MTCVAAFMKGGLILAVIAFASCASAGVPLNWTPPTGTIHHKTLAVRTNGAKGPPVLLLHGMAGSSSYWGAAFDRLAADHRLIVPDLLGFGDSPKPDAPYAPEDHAHAIMWTLHQLDIHEAVIIGAHSAGSLIALYLAANYPKMVKSVTLFGPPLYPNRDAARERIDNFEPLGRFLAADNILAKTFCKLFHSFPSISVPLVGSLYPNFPDQIKRDSTKHTWNSYWGTMRHVVLCAEGEDWIRLARSVPIRLVLGTSDEVADPAYFLELARKYPNVTVSFFDSGGHHLPLTHPDDAMAMILGTDQRRLKGPQRNRHVERDKTSLLKNN